MNTKSKIYTQFNSGSNEDITILLLMLVPVLQFLLANYCLCLIRIYQVVVVYTNKPITSLNDLL